MQFLIDKHTLISFKKRFVFDHNLSIDFFRLPKKKYPVIIERKRIGGFL